VGAATTLLSEVGFGEELEARTGDDGAGTGLAESAALVGSLGRSTTGAGIFEGCVGPDEIGDEDKTTGPEIGTTLAVVLDVFPALTSLIDGLETVGLATSAIEATTGIILV
jgi:hypothetical protein